MAVSLRFLRPITPIIGANGPDDPFRPHFEFVVDARGVAFRREKEAVPALECLNVRNNAHASGS